MEKSRSNNQGQKFLKSKILKTNGQEFKAQYFHCFLVNLESETVENTQKKKKFLKQNKVKTYRKENIFFFSLIIRPWEKFYSSIFVVFFFVI